MDPSAEVEEEPNPDEGNKAMEQRSLPTTNDDGSGSRKPFQLTIFYNGSIRVFDSVTAEKAQAVMLIAAATAAASAGANDQNAKLPISDSNAGVDSSLVSTRSPSSQSSTGAAAATVSSQPPSPQPVTQLLPNTSSPLCKLQADLPIARRLSLQRFLEKRRDRLVSKTPYSKVPETPTSNAHDKPSTPLSCLNDTAGSTNANVAS